MEMLNPSTSKTQLEGKQRRSKNQSRKKWRQQLPTKPTTQNVLKQTDGQGTLDTNSVSGAGRSLFKPISSRHYMSKTSNQNLDDGSSSDLDVYDRNVQNNSDSDSSSSIEECGSTWKLQLQPTSRQKIRGKNSFVQSSSNMEICGHFWNPPSNTTTSLLKKSDRPMTTMKQSSDSESSSSLNDDESRPTLKPHPKSVGSRHKILDENTGEKGAGICRPTPFAKPTPSHQQNFKQFTGRQKYGSVRMRRATPKESIKPSANQEISSYQNSASTGWPNSYATQNLVTGTSRQIKPNVKRVRDLYPSATCSATNIDLHISKKCSILKKSHLGSQRPNSKSNTNTQSVMPEKKQPVANKAVEMFGEVVTPARGSPRKRPNTPEYNAKKKLRTDVDLPSHPRLTSGPEKRRQLLQHNTQAEASVGEDVDDNEDNFERHSPLVRGKTRSRTRYYSTVGAVHSPPEPEDYACRRTWPADQGLVYAEYPRDFVDAVPRLAPPTNEKEECVHRALHCIIAIVAFTTAAGERGSITACEITLLQFMLRKMGEFVHWETAGNAPREASISSQLYQGIENMQITEHTNMESMFRSKTKFLDMFGLATTDHKKNPLSIVEEETIWMKAVKELILHIEHIILQHYKEPSEQASDKLGLVDHLNQLLLVTSLLYSAVSRTPHDTVKEYIDSQTPQQVTEWMKDMLT